MIAYLTSTILAFVILQTTLPSEPLLHLGSSLGLGGVMFYFYRHDVVNKRDSYETIIKDNTKAITTLVTLLDARGTITKEGQ